MTTNSFDAERISASAGDVERTAVVATRPSASVDLRMLFMVFLLFDIQFLTGTDSLSKQ
jgi:hypothetical protein